MKVCLVSSRTRFDPEQTLGEIGETIRLASEEGCDLVCYPEFTIGGLPTGHFETDVAHAVWLSGPFVTALACLAQSHRVHIAIGLLEVDAGSLYDSGILIGPAGELKLHYHRISPTWRPHAADPDRYRDGSRYEVAAVGGRIVGFALCGDIFYDSVIELARSCSLDLLLVPLYRGFDEDCPSEEAWHESEKYAYARRTAQLGVPAAVVNAYNDQDEDTAFGGCLIISGRGEILAEGEIGAPGVLVGEMPTAS